MSDSRNRKGEKPMGVGIIGVGNIAGQYFDTLEKLDAVEVVAVADLDRGRAEAAASARKIPALEVDELLASRDVGIVLNLTVPAAHGDVDLAAIGAGKHVYAEKPLALSLASGQRIIAQAQAAGLRVGSAPDTFLGMGLQTSLDALTAGWIGQPFAASAFWGTPGHEQWHPN
ncbi:MAG: Gfo/Idh/MocA family oxidoreductase, partial [Bifidobacteriaceae bacterium]|nr:Gfo/Idh/MocA family oxidoreductase [Bifidobacteriaceae bacterium]